MANKWLAPLALAAGLAFAAPAAADEANLRASRVMIEAAQMSDLFEPIDEDHLAVRHIASGMICHFRADRTHTQLATFQGLPRGEDIGCVADSATQFTTLYATRYAPPRTAEDSLSGAVAAIRQRFPDARPTPQSVEVASEGLPAQHTAFFLANINGQRHITGAITARFGDWSIKLRYTAPCPTDEEIMRHQLEAGALFTLALLDLQKSGGAPI